MQAIILAGGFGTRLKQVVSDVPKPMAPIDGTPFLELILSNLEKSGFQSVVLSVGYQKEKITHYFGNNYKKIQISYALEDQPLGTGGAISKALSNINLNEPCFVFNGDTFVDVDYRELLNYYNQLHINCMIIANYVSQADRYGLLEINQNDEVILFKEKQNNSSGYINSGLYIINPQYFQSIFIDKVFSFEQFLQNHIQNIKPKAYKTNGYFIDIGIPEDYFKAQTELKNKIKFAY